MICEKIPDWLQKCAVDKVNRSSAILFFFQFKYFALLFLEAEN